MNEFEVNPGSPREVYMSETDAETIDRQIAEGILAEGIDGPSFFNNFCSNFPGEYVRTFVDRLDVHDEPMLTPGDVTTASREDGKLRYGDRAMSTSWRAFFLEIDQAMEQVGVSAEEAARLIVAAQANFSDGGLTDYIVPVYRELRQRGYAHGELTR